MHTKSNQQTLADFPTARAVSDGSPRGFGFGEFWIELSRYIPNGIVFAIAAIGFASEILALSQMQQPITQSGWRTGILAPLFVMWFWLTVGLCLHKASVNLLALKSGSSLVVRTLCYGGFFTAFAVFIGMYATSWGLFQKTSRFANWEVLRFSFLNVGELAKYVSAAEPLHLLYGASVLVAALASLWLLLKPLSRVRHAVADCPLPLNRLWVLMTTLTLAAFALVKHNPSADLAHRDLVKLKHGLNPMVTLVGTAVESFRLAPIDQVILDPASELTPMATVWSAGLATGQSASELPSIIMIQVESLRSDVVNATHQGQEVMPHLNQLAKRALIWKNAYAQSTHSDYADPCIVSSLYPLRTRIHHYYTPTDPWPKRMSYDCLSELGYATATISSQNEMWSGMEYFLDSPNLDFFYHPERTAGGPTENEALVDVQSEDAARDTGFSQSLEYGLLKAGKFSDRHTTSVAIDWIAHQVSHDQPFLLNMNLQSSHFPYLIPTDASQPFQPCEIPSNASFAWYEPRDTEVIRNAYYNALHEIDVQLGRLLDTLRDTGRLENTILVVMGENGESFHENQQVCHANKPYEPAIHIATVMYGPKWLGEGEEDYPLEHIDILPTLFGRIGIKPHPNFQGIDALAADRPALESRFLFCHTHSPISEVDSLQWAGRWKFLHDRQLGQNELFDLATDPKESSNLVAQFPALATELGEQLERWRSRQLAWYHYPQLYQNYFPPAAPTVDAETKAFLSEFLLHQQDASQQPHRQDSENY